MKHIYTIRVDVKKPMAAIEIASFIMSERLIVKSPVDNEPIRGNVTIGIISAKINPTYAEVAIKATDNYIRVMVTQLLIARREVITSIVVTRQGLFGKKITHIDNHE